VGRDSSVGIATGYGLNGPGIEFRWGARFSAPVQTGPGAHPAWCTMGTGSFPGVKNGRGVTLTTHSFLLLWSRKSRAIPLLPLGAVRSVQSLRACTRVHRSIFPFSVQVCFVSDSAKACKVTDFSCECVWSYLWGSLCFIWCTFIASLCVCAKL